MAVHRRRLVAHPVYSSMNVARTLHITLTESAIDATPWATEKGATFYFYDNFGKCGPISIILSLLDS